MSIVSLLDYVVDPFDLTEDITAAFDLAFADSLVVRVPVRRNSAGDLIAYRLNALQPPRGAQILCESKDVLLEQLDQSNKRTQPLFASTKGTGEVRLVGGSFSNCATVWEHSGNSALFDCDFRDMHISGCLHGFKLSSAAGCVFDTVRIRGGNPQTAPVDWGIVLDGSGTGQTNTNSIINCKFTRIKECGVAFGSDQTPDAPQVRNAISGCWFENIQGCAISIEGITLNLHITDCYFEKCSNTGADVVLSPKSGESVHGLVIENCAFATPSPLQKWRIDVTGLCAARFADNRVSLGDTASDLPRVFLHLDTSLFSYELSNNYLLGSQRSASATYEARLLSIEPGRTPSVSWTSQPGSGLVAADEGPIRVFSGRSIPVIRDASNFDLALDVRDGHTFRLAGGGSLRLITNGYLGQQIVLLADSKVTIIDNSTVPRPTESNIELSGNSNFAMTPGATLSLIYANLGGNERWYEVNRSFSSNPADRFPGKTLSIFDFGDADPAGGTDNAVILQAAFDAVSESDHILDLEGGSYRFNTQLTLTGRCQVVNGKLYGSVDDTGVPATNWLVKISQGSETYARPILRDLIIRRLQFADKIGLVIERGLRIQTDNLRFENFRSGNCVPLKLFGVQVGVFTNLVIEGFGLHALEVSGLTGFTATTDIHFLGCSFINGLSAVAGSTIYCPQFGSTAGAAGLLFTGGSVENAFGHAVELIATRRVRFEYVRFETIAAGFSYVRLRNPSADPTAILHTLLGCSFASNDGVTPIVDVGTALEATLLMGNAFPSAGLQLTDNGNNTRAVGNNNLTDI